MINYILKLMLTSQIMNIATLIKINKGIRPYLDSVTNLDLLVSDFKQYTYHKLVCQQSSEAILIKDRVGLAQSVACPPLAR